MSNDKCYYFDANVLFKHYHSEKPEIEIRCLSINHIVYVSNLGYLEVLGVFMRYLRQNKLKKRTVDRIIERLQHDIGTSSRDRFQLVPSQEGIFRDARTLMTQYAKDYELSCNDALHIAIAKTLTSVIMVTSDGGKSLGKMKGVCAKVGLEVFDPEILV